jgi:hypothetical protein
VPHHLRLAARVLNCGSPTEEPRRVSGTKGQPLRRYLSAYPSTFLARTRGSPDPHSAPRPHRSPRPNAMGGLPHISLVCARGPSGSAPPCRIAPQNPLGPTAARRIARPSAGSGSPRVPEPDRGPGVPPTGGLGSHNRSGSLDCKKRQFFKRFRGNRGRCGRLGCRRSRKARMLGNLDLLVSIASV